MLHASEHPHVSQAPVPPTPAPSRLVIDQPQLIGPVARLPPDILSALTPDQLARLAHCMAPQTRAHLVDFQVSLPTPWRRLYLRVFCGREKRSVARLLAENQISLAKSLLVYGVAFWFVLAMATLGTVALAYIVNSALGINLFRGTSPLHFLYVLLFR